MKDTTKTKIKLAELARINAKIAMLKGKITRLKADREQLEASFEENLKPKAVANERPLAAA